MAAADTDPGPLGLYGYEESIFVDGLLVNIQVALASLAIALILGLAGALAKLSPNVALRAGASVYTTFIRGWPDLVLMLLIFFGGQVLVNDIALWLGHEGYIDINPFVAGTITIGFIFGAYMTETFRGAILAVPAGQMEAAAAYGMSGRQAIVRILVPQMMRHALPGLGNNWLVLLKTTALVSVIGLDDMVRKAGLASGATRDPFRFYFAVAIGFLVLTTLSVLVLRALEKHYGAGHRRA